MRPTPLSSQRLLTIHSLDGKNSTWSFGLSKEALVEESLTDVSLCHSFLSMSLASHTNSAAADLTRQLWHETEAIRLVRQHLEDLERNGQVASDSDIWACALVGLQHVSTMPEWIGRWSGEANVTNRHSTARRT